MELKISTQDVDLFLMPYYVNIISRDDVAKHMYESRVKSIFAISQYLEYKREQINCGANRDSVYECSSFFIT